MTSNNVQQPVYVQQTCTTAELSTAGMVGLLTAGPLGALASYRVLKEFQGKWGGWFIAGLVGAPLCLGIQLIALSVVGSLLPESDKGGSKVEQVSLAPAAPVLPSIPTVAQSASRNLDTFKPQPSSPERIALLHSMFENDPFVK
jgi:hypothetical protein